MSLTLQPGTTYTLATAIESSDDTSSYQSTAQSMASSLTTLAVRILLSAHESWWQSYWSQSFVQIPDQAVEKSWYGSLYLLGSVTRSGKYAPGLWGNWITGPMNWNGDYHTNYDYEAPFYAALSTNHIAQMGSYAQPILQYEANGGALAQPERLPGRALPGRHRPNGMTTDSSLHNQKSDAAYLASDMVMEYEYTHSTTYAAKVLPVPRAGRAVLAELPDPGLHGHLQHRQRRAAGGRRLPADQQRGVARPGAPAVPGPDRHEHRPERERLDSIPTWQNINAHLAPQPTTTRERPDRLQRDLAGRRLRQRRQRRRHPGRLPGQPGRPRQQRHAAAGRPRTPIGQLTNAWDGGNAPATFYAAAARVGYNPSTIMSNLNDEATNQSYNNMAVHHNGGGIENLNVTTSGLDEMLLQSFQNDVKVFAGLAANSNAKFGDLLAYGDFLISSSIQNNTVQYVQAVSQAGGNYVFTNPWPGQSMEYYDNGTDQGTLSGTEITLSTTAGRRSTSPRPEPRSAPSTPNSASRCRAAAPPRPPTAARRPRCRAPCRPRTTTPAARGWPTTSPRSTAPATATAPTASTWRPPPTPAAATTWAGPATGQWFKYTVNVATAGTYTVGLRVAAPTAVTDALHIANAPAPT